MLQRKIRNRLKGLLVDLKNYYNYGSAAPKYGELLFVKTEDIVKRIYARDIESTYHSGRVVKEWNNDKEVLIDEEEKTKALHRRFVLHNSWEESGYIEILLHEIETGLCNAYQNKEQIIHRCKNLDKLYEDIKRDKKLKLRKELNKHNYRELGGIEISVSNKNELIKTHGGNHRLILAKFLNIETIPAMIGLVHEDALDKFVEIREKSQIIHNQTIQGN